MLSAIFKPNSPRKVVLVGAALFHFSFLTITKMVTKISLTSHKNSRIDVYVDKKLPDLEYADDDVLLDENPSGLSPSFERQCRHV